MEMGGIGPWVDVPREQWPHDPELELLPLERQRYWQQKSLEYGAIRYANVSRSIIQQEVFGHVMGRVVAALDRLEQRLDR